MVRSIPVSFRIDAGSSLSSYSSIDTLPFPLVHPADKLKSSNDTAGDFASGGFAVTPSARVRTGLECLADQGFAPLRGLRVGLLTHPAAVDGRLRHIRERLAEEPGVHLAARCGPEHGLMGEAQDLIGVEGGTEAGSGLRIHSLYGDSFDSLSPSDEQLRGLDALVIDLQDVGSRYYTFQATMLLC